MYTILSSAKLSAEFSSCNLCDEHRRSGKVHLKIYAELIHLGIQFLSHAGLVLFNPNF